MDLILETPRLILREMRHEDANSLFEMDCNTNVHKYLWQKPVVQIDEVHAYIDMVDNNTSITELGVLSLLLKLQMN